MDSFLKTPGLSMMLLEDLELSESSESDDDQDADDILVDDVLVHDVVVDDVHGDDVHDADVHVDDVHVDDVNGDDVEIDDVDVDYVLIEDVKNDAVHDRDVQIEDVNFDDVPAVNAERPTIEALSFVQNGMSSSVEVPALDSKPEPTSSSTDDTVMTDTSLDIPLVEKTKTSMISPPDVASVSCKEKIPSIEKSKPQIPKPQTSDVPTATDPEQNLPRAGHMELGPSSAAKVLQTPNGNTTISSEKSAQIVKAGEEGPSASFNGSISKKSVSKKGKNDVKSGGSEKLPEGPSDQAEGQIKKEDTEENELMRFLLSHFNEDQWNRYESYRRSTFDKKLVKKMMQKIVGASVSQNAVIAMAGIAKVFAGEIVETALEVKEQFQDSGPLTPKHLREAARRMRRDGLIPTRTHQFH